MTLLESVLDLGHSFKLKNAVKLVLKHKSLQQSLGQLQPLLNCMFNKKQGMQKIQDNKGFVGSKEFKAFRQIIDGLEQEQAVVGQGVTESKEETEDDEFEEAELDYALIEQQKREDKQ